MDERFQIRYRNRVERSHFIGAVAGIAATAARITGHAHDGDIDIPGHEILGPDRNRSAAKGRYP